MKRLSCSILRAILTFASTVAATTTSFDANYDDLPATEAGSVASGLGTYNALTYNSFIVVSNSLALAGGVAPHSPPNNIITGASFQSTNGTPSITVAPPYTKFSLNSFWFGCDAELQEAVVNVATQCTITLAAFEEASEEEVAVASYTFTPPEDQVDAGARDSGGVAEWV